MIYKFLKQVKKTKKKVTCKFALFTNYLTLPQMVFIIKSNINQ